jgi:hypothetical protein
VNADDPGTFHFPPDWALERLPGDEDQDWRVLFRRGDLEFGIYAPRGRDEQQPHDRDELYAVISGSGWFRNGARRHPFGPGDLLFVPAGTEHGFEEFDDDFATWAVFFGPRIRGGG